MYCIKNVNIAKMIGENYGLLQSAAVVIDDNKILWCGKSTALPSAYKSITTLDMQGRLLTPGLIDCHTHSIFGGNRAQEYAMRLQGATYEQIAKQGGGILSTVEATRSLSEDDLLQITLPYIDNFIKQGVTTIEIKSGYGLDQSNELKMLRVARRIAQSLPIRVKTTFLAAHTIPIEYRGRADKYIDEVCIPTLHLAHKQGLVDAVDGFCESIAFSWQQIERLFCVARQLKLPFKLHAEQLSRSGDAQKAAEYGATSLEHLEYADESTVSSMQNSGTIAVLLPGALYNLAEQQKPPIALLRKYAVPMAVATDFNPGSSPLASISVTMHMATRLLGLTVEESLQGVTVNAARSLGLPQCGQIVEGHTADLAIWNASHPAELVYWIGYSPLYKRIFNGKLL